MVALPDEFDPGAVPPGERNFEPLPAGTYKLQVVDSKIDDTSTGSGQMITLTLEVVEGKYERRKLWDRLNIRNASPEAQRIAQEQLAALCRSIGIEGKVKDTEALHFKPFTARVTVQTDKTGQYGPQNRVNYIDPAAAKAPAGKQNAQAAAKSAAPASAAPAKPWAQPHKNDDMNDEVPF